MSAGSSARRKVQKAQGTFEGATARKIRLAQEKAKLSAPKGWDKVEPDPEAEKAQEFNEAVERDFPAEQVAV